MPPARKYSRPGSRSDGGQRRNDCGDATVIPYAAKVNPYAQNKGGFQTRPSQWEQFLSVAYAASGSSR